MPKVTVTFKLPEEQSEYEMAAHAGDMYSLISDWERYLRNTTKYPDENEWHPAQLRVVEKLREEWFKIKEANNVKEY